MIIPVQKLRDNVTLPDYQTKHSAAMDLHAAIDEPMTLEPMSRALVPCGFAIALPVGYELQIRARSGLSLKYGMCLANGIGTIDSDYRGEIQVIMINLGNEPYTIDPDERIAQMLIAKYQKIQWEPQDKLAPSDRASGGFGSTGKF